jgi:hypothetical protein
MERGFGYRMNDLSHLVDLLGILLFTPRLLSFELLQILVVYVYPL